MVLHNGFDTGIRDLPNAALECGNNLSAWKDSDFVVSALRQEVDSGFMIGPFTQLPVEWNNFRVKPFGCGNT